MSSAAAPLLDWLRAHDGIAHRLAVLDAGFALAGLRAFVREGHGQLIRRAWVALDDADADLVTAARAGGRISCVSAARRRGWWMPESVEAHPHLHLHPRAGSARLGDDWKGVLHWARPVVPALPHTLTTTIEDALAHIAVCQPREVARVLWESAARAERLAPEYLRSVGWVHIAARELAEEVTGLSDSGLETLVVAPLRKWGVSVRQQVVLAGRPVDVLIGERLVVQIDGYAFHSSSADRTRDLAHDAELRLRGFTVLRFSYAQVVHDRRHVEQTILRAIAARLHVVR